MINVSIRKADFDELDVNRITKMPILDTLEQFWQKSQADYDNFLKANGIERVRHFSSLQELKDFSNTIIDKLNVMADRLNQVDNFGFDFRIANQLKSRYFKLISDYDFIKMTFDLREIDTARKIIFKDLFAEIKSASLIDFKEINDESCSIIYHKKGGLYYNDEPCIYTSSFSLSLLESFDMPRGNNFVMARFVLDLAKRLNEKGIDEVFYVIYTNDNKNIKSVEEILQWAILSIDEKRALKQSFKESSELDALAKEQAHNELKDEVNARRNSLDSLQGKIALEQNKFIKVEKEYSEDEIDELFSVANIDKQEKSIKEIEQENKDKIHQIVYKSIEYYKEKEIQKTNIRLERAQKDSQRAYDDLKKYIENGASILEAVQNIKQKYSNDDTIHLATLLFNQDILNVKSKDEIIAQLNMSNENLKNECNILNEKIDKKNETISSLKSTIQKKVNEIQNFEYDLRQEFDEQLKAKENEMLEGLEELKKSQDEIVENFKVEIEELNNENDEMYKEKEQLKEQNMQLNAQNTMLENALKDAKSEFESLKKETQDKLMEADKIIKELYKFQARENIYKEQINELKNRNESLEQKLNSLINSFAVPLAQNQIQTKKPRATRSDKGKKRT